MYVRGSSAVTLESKNGQICRRAARTPIWSPLIVSRVPAALDCIRNSSNLASTKLNRSRQEFSFPSLPLLFPLLWSTLIYSVVIYIYISKQCIITTSIIFAFLTFSGSYSFNYWNLLAEACLLGVSYHWHWFPMGQLAHEFGKAHFLMDPSIYPVISTLFCRNDK